MKSFLLIAAICCASVSIAQISASFDAGSISFQTIEGDDGNSYALLKAGGLYNYAEPGMPFMPVKFFTFLVPADKQLTNLRVSNSNSTFTTLTVPIYPGQEPSPDPDIVAPFVEPDASVYGSDLRYPAMNSKAFIADIGWYGSNKLVTVGVHLSGYYPAQGYLYYYSHISLTATYTSASGLPAIQRRPQQRWDEEIAYLKQKVVNPEKVEEYYAYNNSLFNTLKSDGDNYEYIIVCPDELCPAFDEFLFWKRRKGVNAGIVKLSTILNTYSGDLISGIYDGPGKLRQYLREKWGNGLKYALIVGDASNSPVRLDAGNTSTDYYFSELTGDWDFDNDKKIGEFGDDKADYYPEVAVGRLLCTTIEEATNWVRKAFIYEQNPGLGDASYLTKSLFISADEFYTEPDSIIPYLPEEFTCKRISERPSAEADPVFGPTGKEVIDELSKGYGFFGSFVHGSRNTLHLAYDSVARKGATRFCITAEDWQGSPSNENGNGLDNLTNYSKPSVYFGMSCSVVPLNKTKSTEGSQNVGEGFVNNKGGGVAFLGGIANLYSYETGNMFRVFVKGLGTENISNKFGNLLQYAKDTLLVTTMRTDQYGNKYIGKATRDRILYFSYYHTLIGCPEMEMWAGSPKQVGTVNVSKNGTKLSVTLSSLTGAKICVCSADGKSYYEVRQLAESENEATFENVPDNYLVTITKQGYLPLMIDDNYIQNETFTECTLNYSTNPLIGYDVTNTKAYGEVVIKSDGCLILNNPETVKIKNGFKIEIGGKFVIKQQ